MEYREFNDSMARIKSIEDHGAYAEAQKHYQILLKEQLDANQYAIVLIGSATCFLRASDSESAGKVINELSLPTLDGTVQAVICNLRAQISHELGNYEEAIVAGQEAEKIARELGSDGLDVLGEALSRQGFAEAELGRLKEASEHLAIASKMPVERSILMSISLYTAQFHLNYPKFL
jgi:tetratricopeptide (TPR) repeat protein